MQATNLTDWLVLLPSQDLSDLGDLFLNTLRDAAHVVVAGCG